MNSKMPHCLEAAAAAPWIWRSLEEPGASCHAAARARLLLVVVGGGRRCLASECNNHPTRENVLHEYYNIKLQGTCDKLEE